MFNKSLLSPALDNETFLKWFGYHEQYNNVYVKLVGYCYFMFTIGSLRSFCVVCDHNGERIVASQKLPENEKIFEWLPKQEATYSQYITSGTRLPSEYLNLAQKSS